MFIAALFIVAKNQKQPKCPSTGEWISKLWFIHTIECYSAIKRKKLRIHVTTWMNIRSIVLCERSQTERTIYLIVPFIWHSRKGKTRNRKIRSVVVKDRAAWGWDWLQEGAREIFGVEEALCVLIEMMVKWLHAFVQTNQTVYLKNRWFYYI